MKIYDLLTDYPDIWHPPYRQDGGLMRLVLRIVDLEKPLNAIIYLMHLADASSAFSKALALKRWRVIHGKPFLFTLAGGGE